MARGINKVILVGNLGNDPETRYTQGGMAITRISLATTSVRKDKDGSGYKVILEAAPEGMYSENVEEGVAAMSEVVSRYVRNYPSQYMWSMKRFKKRPDGEAKWY